MTINDLLKQTNWKCSTPNLPLDKEIHGAFVGDLLSWVMGNGEQDQAWITVQVHLNVIAVAKLREFSCIILADGAVLEEDVLQKALEEEIVIIESNLPSFETAKKLIELGV